MVYDHVYFKINGMAMAEEILIMQILSKSESIVYVCGANKYIADTKVCICKSPENGQNSAQKGCRMKTCTNRTHPYYYPFYSSLKEGLPRKKPQLAASKQAKCHV